MLRIIGLRSLVDSPKRLNEGSPNERTTVKPDRNAVRRAAFALARDIRIKARIIELRRLAEQTARGELPVFDDDPAQRVIDNDK